ncbi:NF-kappa-B inhibitor epsilon-like [Acanthaster planci]|uniref:NF-kappa-B inhibitor epsilon-like n=1 Tax=Acanthaster planci TaxID=133434 RepID=A0A8B7YNM5_ACAPL|nr:NF-kappa-B inhibitor epsilon-like [Acanthaster planci]
MSLPCDVETDCAMESPAEASSKMKNLPFDPKYRHLSGVGTSDRFDSHDSGIDSYRSVDSSFCFSTDSGRTESPLTSINEHESPLSQRLGNLHISSSLERCKDQESRTDTKLNTAVDDEAFVDSPATGEGISHLSGVEASTVVPTDETDRSGHGRYLTDDAYDQDQEGDTPLHLAIIHQKEDIAVNFIRLTLDPDLLNIRNDLAQTPLHLSVLTRQPVICRALILAGAQVDSIDRNGDTPLHIACKLSDDGCIRALTERISPLELQKGMVQHTAARVQQLPQDLELRNFEGFTCIHILGFLGDLEHLDYLVQLGANINAPDGKSGRTALHYAVEMGSLMLTHHLVNVLDADVDAMTYDLCTPLHLAVGRQLKAIVMLLVESKADTDVTNFEGDRPCDLSDDSQIMMYVKKHPHDDNEMIYSDIRIQGQ